MSPKLAQIKVFSFSATRFMFKKINFLIGAIQHGKNEA
jgi:hypothetical protein